MSEPTVLRTRQGSTAILTLDDPQHRNVLSAPMVAAIGAAYDDLERDADVTGVVLTGAGSAFCAGAELSTLERAAAGDMGPVESVYDGFLRVLRSPLVTIAAVNGPAVGAGFNLALACDVRIAAHGALFDTRFTALDLHPGGGHTWLLQRAVGAQNAALVCLFGQVWDAERARAGGLVASVHDAAELLPAAVALAGRLAGHDPALVRRITASLRLAASGSVGHDEMLRVETEAQEWSLRQPSFLRSLAAIRRRITQPR